MIVDDACVYDFILLTEIHDCRDMFLTSNQLKFMPKVEAKLDEARSEIDKYKYTLYLNPSFLSVSFRKEKLSVFLFNILKSCRSIHELYEKAKLFCKIVLNDDAVNLRKHNLSKHDSDVLDNIFGEDKQRFTELAKDSLEQYFNLNKSLYHIAYSYAITLEWDFRSYIDQINSCITGYKLGHSEFQKKLDLRNAELAIISCSKYCSPDVQNLIKEMFGDIK